MRNLDLPLIIVSMLCRLSRGVRWRISSVHPSESFVGRFEGLSCKDLFHLLVSFVFFLEGVHVYIYTDFFFTIYMYGSVF